MHLPDDDHAVALVAGDHGILCNWWRSVEAITPSGIAEKLSAANLDMHVNHFDEPDPATGKRFSEQTPFISLSAGTVERDAAAQTNLVHRARRTAAWFGTEFGTKPTAYLFTCWVILAPRPAVGVEGVAEEVRDLNAYRRYSPFQTEGEVTAKISVPARQILSVERWDWDRASRSLSYREIHRNPSFLAPEVLSNVRELI
jgi:hypothetical protein